MSSDNHWEAIQRQTQTTCDELKKLYENMQQPVQNSGNGGGGNRGSSGGSDEGDRSVRKPVRKEYSYEQLLRDDPSGMAMLDQALEGASTEAKARVRNVLLRFGIEPDHEFYIIFVAIGQLLILVEEAPENWRALFDDVHRELKQWSQENFKSLQSIQRHAQTSAELIAVLKQLLDSMKVSEGRSSETKATLQALRLKLSSIENSLDSILSSSSRNQSSLDQLSGQVSELSESANRREWISIFSLWMTTGAVGLLLLSHWSVTRQLTVQELLVRRQRERIDWLLEKANREECLTGIMPASDPQCRQYF